MKKIHRRKIITSIALTVLLSLGGVFTLILRPVHAAWYTTGGTWNYRQQITINHTKVPNTDQANFPVLVKITDEANTLFTRAQADGDDILFTSSDETTKLSHEIEKFTVTEGSRELIAWVKIPLLATAADTIIYMYYGNSAALSQQNATDVWSNGYAGVWHLNDNAANTSVANSLGINNGTLYSVSTPINTNTKSVAGEIGSALGLNGTSDFAKVNHNATFNLTSGWTTGTWVKRTGTAGNNSDGSTWKIIVRKGVYNTFGLMTNKNDWKVVAAMYSSNWREVSSTSSLGLDEWHYVVSNYSTSNGGTLKIYFDGVLENTATSMGTPSTNTDPLWIGSGSAVSGVSTYWPSIMDQSYVSTVARSPEWIATEYANQNDPATFFSLAAEDARDSIAPSNPTVITGLNEDGGATELTSGNFYNYATPYFSWPAAGALGGASDTGEHEVSGVAGYYSYFGTSCGGGGADPYLTRGVLSDTGGGKHYSADTNVTVPDLTTNYDTYCLRIKTADAAGNISGTTWEAFTYGFDAANPNPPAFIAASPAGYSAIDSFDFSWPVPTDVGGSGIQGYQYKRGGTSGDAWSATIVPATIAGIASYQTGENIFIVRSVDNANNTSAEVQTTYYYSADPPGPPTALLADPLISDANSFEFSWTAPVHARPIVDYGYVINAVPTINNLTWLGSSSTSLTADAYATQQGVNTLYLVAKDDSGAYSLDGANYAQEDFNCTTVAPPIPITVSITDSSDQVLSRYMLTIQWAAGVGQGASFDHYSIERSTDGVAFTEIATTTSTAYIDASSLDNTTTYYYLIKSVDNAGSSSAASTIVSKIPTGRFTTAPTILSGPTAAAGATTATITWVVNRESTGGVRYGTSAGSLASSQVSSTLATEHTIELTGLEPATTYYYQVQALDVLRDYTLESAYSATHTFTTSAAPVIANVTVSNITLTTADISWETTSASNTKVHYGTSISYTTIVPESETSMTTQHSIKLTDLLHTTKYHFKIYGPDVSANILSSDDYTFDTLSLPVVSSILFTSDFSGPTPQVKITWLTSDTPTTSSVTYRPYGSGAALQSSNQSELVEEHVVTITGLENNTSYEFTLSGVDQFGNEAVSDLQIFQTTPDKRAPVIFNITIESSNVGSGSANDAKVVISWETDEPSTSQVAYGEGLSNNDYPQKTPPDVGLVQKHLVIISGLKPQTPYHFKMMSVDDTENLTESSPEILVSGQVTGSVLNLVTKTLNNIFGWIGKMW